MQWCKYFLSNRKQRVELGDYISMWKLLISGVPQGSDLDTLLFVIFNNY